VNSNLVYNRILEFKAKEQIINVGRLKNLTLANKNVPFKIWGSTLDGDTYSGREVFTFFGPSKNGKEYAVGYNYNQDGYMIMYDMSIGEPRTFVYERITKLELNGVTYKIQ
jgi:hypothetical protein